MLALILAMSCPAVAQDDVSDDGTSERATDPLQNQTATIIEDADDNDGGKVDRIEITAPGCEVGQDATVTVADADSIPETFTNNDGATITPDQSLIIVDRIRPRSIDDRGFGPRNQEEDGTVTDSTGIQCGPGREADDGGTEGDGVQTADDLLTISCEDLLELFRSETGQYGDAALFADPGVRDRVEECLEEEVVGDTAADEDLPDTGGVSLFGLALLLAVSAGAGLAVVRGGRTDR